MVKLYPVNIQKKDFENTSVQFKYNMSSQTSFSESTDGRLRINNLNARNAHVCLKITTIRYMLSLNQLYH